MSHLLLTANYKSDTDVPGAREFIAKVIRVRSKLLAEKKGNCSMAMIQTHSTVKKWYEFYKPNSAQCATYMARNNSMIRMIIPGPGSPLHQSFIKQLDDICNQIK